MAGIIQRSNFPSLMVDGLNILFEDTMEMMGKEQFADVFHILDSKKMFETNIGTVGMGTVPLKPELNRIMFDAPRQGRPVTYVHSTYALAVGISKEADEDDRSGQLAKLLIPELTKSMRVTREMDAASLLNNGFTAQGYSPDAKALFAPDHPLVRSGFGSTVWANKISSDAALTSAGLQAARATLRRTISESGKKMPIIAIRLVIPPELESTAEELTLSINKPIPQAGATHAPNEINVFNRAYKLQPLVLDYLTSTTAWFLVAEMADTHIKWYDRIKPEFKANEEDWHADAIMAKVRARWSRGYDDGRGWFGSDGV